MKKYHYCIYWRAWMLLLASCFVAGCGFLFGEEDFDDEVQERQLRPTLLEDRFAVDEGRLDVFPLRLLSSDTTAELQSAVNPDVADGRFFEVDIVNVSANGREVPILLRQPLDFENPEDLNADNTYEVQLDVFRGNQETNLTFTVRVDNTPERTDAGFAMVGQFLTGRWGQSIKSYPDIDGDGRPEILVSHRADSAQNPAIDLIRSRAFSEIDGSVLALSAPAVDPGLTIDRRSQPQRLTALDGDDFDLISDIDGDSLPEIIVSGFNRDSVPLNVERAPEQAFIVLSRALVAELNEAQDDGVGISLDDVGNVAGIGVPIRSDDSFDTGFALAVLGDVDGDAISDVGFCVSGFRVSTRVIVVFGRALLAARALGTDIQLNRVAENRDGVMLVDNNTSSQNPGLLCENIAAAGDLNGDGVDELVFGSTRGSVVEPGAAQTSGEAYIVSGDIIAAEASPDEDGLIDLTDAAVPGLAIARNSSFPGLQRIGHALESAGDLNQDGFDDLLLGAPGVLGERVTDEESGIGRVYIVFGRQDFFPVARPAIIDMNPDMRIEPFAVITSTRIEYGFGYSVAGAGDVTGDGIPDVLISEPFDGPIGASERSLPIEQTHLISGAEINQALDYDLNQLLANSDFTKRIVYEGFLGRVSSAVCRNDVGWSLSGTGSGDWDGDGLADILLTAPCGDGTRALRPDLDGDENYGEAFILHSSYVNAVRATGGAQIRLEEVFPALDNN